MKSAQLLEQAEQVLAGVGALQEQLADPALYADQERAIAVNREYAYMQKVKEASNALRAIADERAGAEELMAHEQDSELLALAEKEVAELAHREGEAARKLRLLLLPRDPRDEKSCIIEIRSGTGGDEASLFAADLYRMYQRYIERMGWKGELMSANATEVGGFREIVFSISTAEAFASMKYESGVHRVQRIPTTESSGRLHTSAVTVAVLPEAEEADIDIKNEELRVDVYRSSGPGGQSVNTTDSAVRITHIPSGLVVICQDEKSQHKNRAKAMRVLRSRLYEHEKQKQQAERDMERRSLVGSGDRSERIRTYNFPQNRVTDHRIGLTLHRLEAILDGDLHELIDSLRLYDEERFASVR